MASNASIVFQLLRQQSIKELRADIQARDLIVSDAKRRLSHVQRGNAAFKLGRRRPASNRPKLILNRYLDLSVLPTPPASVDYSPKAEAALARMYLNDQLGDCVIACMAHLVGTFLGNAGQTYILSPAQIVALYSAIGGYIPGHPSTDNGCDEVTALAYWKATGAPAGLNKIAGWVSVDATNPAEYRAALWLFENLFFGVELPDAWVNPFPSSSGFVWDVAGEPDPDNGHCFPGVGYTAEGIKIDTWGMLGTVTTAAVEEYAFTAGSGELYTVLSPEIILKASQKAPNGFDLAQLQADLAAV
jgi:hypothetical protein